jgi:hypothetical protein
MDKSMLILVLVVALAGYFLLGNGITGLVISQSCCNLPNCTPENECTKLSPAEDMHSIYMGAGIIILSLISYITLHFIYKKKK